MASVCELQNSKNTANFKNLRKNLQMASLFKFQKSTKKPANGFSM